MSNIHKNERRLTGYRSDSHDNLHEEYHSYYDSDIEHYNPNLSLSDDDDDVDIYEDYDADFHEINREEKQEEEEEDDSGSELSIPDPNIDFAMVYALHTFTATVEGQATVVRGDPLTLLDDSNSYWWLIKVLNTSVVGYIPAENIETPYERLARLNSHRNVEITRKDIQDAFPEVGSTKPKQTKRVTLAKGVQFQSQIIYGSSDDEDDFQAEFEQWNERMHSEDSETDDQDSDEVSEDPYQFYTEGSEEQQTLDMYSASPTQMDMNDYQITSKTINSSLTNNNYVPDEEPIDYYNHFTQDTLERDTQTDQNRESFQLNEETIKISLTPSIARDDGQGRHSDNDIQAKLKKAAELEKLFNSEDLQQHHSKSITKEKKEKFGLRKFFSRNNKKNKSSDSLVVESRLSNGSSYYESGSVSSSVYERDSIDSTVHPTLVKVYAGNITEFGHVLYKEAPVYPSTTALELIHQLVQLEQDEGSQHLVDDSAYHDYYLIVKTSNGGDYTLVPSDKPLEIFQSLTAHLSTPMPSLKKARRISQLMGSENTIIGGPSPVENDFRRLSSSEDQVRFYLFSKVKRSVDEGEIQIKVSLFSSELDSEQQQPISTKRVDKLVKLSSMIIVKDAITLLLEKFHILNGISASSNDSNIENLRLDEDDDVVRYGLILSNHGVERLLDLDEKLIHVFGENDNPYIQYRRNSNPDRSSITVNIPPPDKNELHFILKRLGKTRTEEHDHPKTRRLVRHNTPLPRSSSHTKHQPPALPSYSSSPSPPSPDSTTVDTPIDGETHHDTPLTTPSPTQRRLRPESTDSMLFCDDFGMNELMMIIRGAAQQTKSKRASNQTASFHIRSEINEVFKDSHSRLDQLEKELDRIMSEAVKSYH